MLYNNYDNKSTEAKDNLAKDGDMQKLVMKFNEDKRTEDTPKQSIPSEDRD